MIGTPEIVLRLLLAGFLSGLVGFERETHGRAAGLRTHIVVGVGAALFMMVSLFVAQVYGRAGSADPGRIAAQVVTGVGFLGAGTILRFGSSIRGLTTAASIWGVAAIGLSMGCGFYQAALAATSILLLVLFFLWKLAGRIPFRVYFKALKIKGMNADRHLEKIQNVLSGKKINIERLTMKRDFLKKELLMFEIFLKIPHKNLEEKLIKEIGALEGIQEITIE